MASKKTNTKNRSSKNSNKSKTNNNGELKLWRIYIGIALVLLSVIITISLISHLFTWQNPEDNGLGQLGQIIAQQLMENAFGVSALLIPVFLFAGALRITKTLRIRLWKWFINCTIIMIWSSVFTAWLQQQIGLEYLTAGLGGMHGIEICGILIHRIGTVGTPLLLFLFVGVYLLYLTGESIHLIRKTLAKLQREKEEQREQQEQKKEEENITEEPLIATNAEEAEKQTATTIDFDLGQKEGESENPDFSQQEMPIEVAGELISESEHTEEQTTTDADLQGATLHLGEKEVTADLDETRALEPYDPKLDLENYKYPTIDLLKKYDIKSNLVDMQEQQKNKTQILNALANFGVQISSIKATVGPTVTLYEITPAPGVRISKIRNLEDDIALSLSALGIRIIAPIPGKGTVGIEVPNTKPQMVSMESIINSRKFQETEYELPMALGKTITNEIYIADLAKMPHLLVAGATGQGKSVGLNAIITSLLYKKHPAELKLVMVDPKKVEFSVYNPIVNHFLAQVEGNEDTEEPIITDVTKVIQTLKSLCQEMDTRYDLLKKAGVRNVKEYNQKFKDRQLNPNNGHKFMPYIVVIIDEFGDLIMMAGKEIELPIARIAQLARAVGIHMIIATQRPTTNIITGTIKANFPARMAFRVGAMVDSRTILDKPGANHLVGKGDMLFQTGAEPIRIQCAFVDTPEVEAIAKFIACQQSYNHPFPLPAVADEEGDGSSADVDMNQLDPMFREVAELIVDTQQGSTSMIQRKFSIGYNRAGRLMDQMEAAGIVGPAHGSKPREVLCVSREDLEFRLSNLNR